MQLALADCPAIETDRLMIRPLTPADAGALADLTDDPAITGAVHFLPSPFGRAEAERLIGSIDERNCYLGLFMQGRIVGVVGTHVHRGDRLEIGYWIGPRFQRRGYASEAARAVIERLRLLAPDWQVTAECLPGNAASWQLLHKLGFRPTGEAGHRPGRALLVLAGD